MSNTVTESHINDLFNQLHFETFHRVFGKQCIIVALLPNGFTIVGESACVDPSNYVERIGAEIALKRIKEKLWELEGYKLQNSLSKGGDDE
jgi:hypothetical protein